MKTPMLTYRLSIAVLFSSLVSGSLHLVALEDIPDRLLETAHAPLGDYTATNPRIDMVAFMHEAETTLNLREHHRLSEARFIELSQQAGVIVLDARSRDMYDLLHIAGAINLPFPDLNEASLAATFPDKKQMILIYCNNNFNKAPLAFAAKRAAASLNISTFISLHTYGYENIYELGPLLDVQTTVIPLVGERE